MGRWWVNRVGCFRWSPPPTTTILLSPTEGRSSVSLSVPPSLVCTKLLKWQFEGHRAIKMRCVKDHQWRQALESLTHQPPLNTKTNTLMCFWGTVDAQGSYLKCSILICWTFILISISILYLKEKSRYQTAKLKLNERFYLLLLTLFMQNLFRCVSISVGSGQLTLFWQGNDNFISNL